MGKTINLCAKIPEELHAQSREEQEELGVTLNEYVKEILEEHFKMKGGKSMNGNTRTIAFQMQDELFDRLKAYLAANKLTQKGFFVGQTEDVVGKWEASQAALRAEKDLEDKAG